MLSWQANLVHQLEELHLIQSSLLPGERFTFVLPPEDLAVWSSLLTALTDAGGLDSDRAVIASLTRPPCQARFQLRLVAAQISFEVELPPCTDVTNLESAANAATWIRVKGDHIARDAQERWHAKICAQAAEVDDECVFPVYELLTLLTATLHQSQAPDPDPEPASTSESAPTPAAAAAAAPSLEPPYHALLTSHHLISPTKRRSMHQWSSQLAITGFAKVGYPGIIYAEGPRVAVETFVRNVKGMQWLALRVRFVEPVLGSGSGSDVLGTTRDQSVHGERWVEVSKIGQVLEQMRMRGRQVLVTNLGIGTPSNEPKH